MVSQTQTPLKNPSSSPDSPISTDSYSAMLDRLTDEAMILPGVQKFRGEIQAKGFRRMSDDELAKARRKYLNAHYSNRIEGIHPSAETWGLFQVLLDERVPAENWSGLVLGFMQRQHAKKRPHKAG